MIVEITLDQSIKAVIRRLIYKTLGQVPISVTATGDMTFEVDITASPTPAEQAQMKTDIETFLEGQGYYVTFTVLVP